MQAVDRVGVNEVAIRPQQAPKRYLILVKVEIVGTLQTEVPRVSNVVGAPITIVDDLSVTRHRGDVGVEVHRVTQEGVGLAADRTDCR